MSKTPSSSGLDAVVFAETLLSHVDGERGHLALRGYDVEDVAGRIDFTDACHLLWNGDLPSRAEHAALARRLGDWRVKLYPQILAVALPGQAAAGAAAHTNGMDFLRAAVGALVLSPDLSAADEREAITAATSVAAATWNRGRTGQAPMPPDASLSPAADYLRTATGRTPDPRLAAGLDAYLVTVSDHGMNASTFTGRVIASTGSDLVSAVTGAIGALKGPLHGGAPGPVLDMLDAIGTPSDAQAWLEAELAAGRRIMGMGHRIYRVRDPRAAVLERAVERLEKEGFRSERLALARAVEQAAAALLKERYPNRPLQANVEFYTAVLLDAVGLPRELFAPTFATSRVAGWCAHVEEQRAHGRLIRPDSRFVGDFRPIPQAR